MTFATFVCPIVSSVIVSWIISNEFSREDLSKWYQIINFPIFHELNDHIKSSFYIDEPSLTGVTIYLQ